MPDPITSNDWLQWVFLAAAALCVFLHIVRGWKRGVMRQIIYLLALALVYPIGLVVGPELVPTLRPLGYPDFLLSAVAGAVVAMVLFFVVTMIGSILFKKTSQQEVGVIRLVYGLGGSALGLVTGLIFVWAMVIGFRLIGSAAESSVEAGRITAREHKAGDVEKVRPPNQITLGVAQMKHSLDHGVAGPMMAAVDPIPEKVHEIFDKAAVIAADPDKAGRFLNFPGAQDLVTNPKVVALRDDADILKLARAKDYLGLLKNGKLVSVANDPTVQALIKKFEFEKALDYALTTPPQNTTPPDNAH